LLVEGIVSAFRLPVSEREVSCTLLTRAGSVSARLKVEPEIYDPVGGAGLRGGRRAYAEIMRSLVRRPDLRKRARKALSECREAYGKPAMPMVGDLARAADNIMRAFISGAPMIVRFHGDGDGVAGAIALYRALNAIVASGLSPERQVSWQVNRDVAYTKEAFYSDRLLFSSFRSAERPLLVIIDFGTHMDSNDAIAMAEKDCNVVWIDHHTLPELFNPGRRSIYINPFNYGSDSRLSAGLVASLIARIIGAECTDLMEAALVSDHSACADYSNAQARKAALVLDYMITRRDPDSSSMRKIDSVVREKARLEEAYAKVGARLDAAIAAGEGAAKRYRTADGVDVYVIDFKKVKDGDYPPPGRFSSEMQYRLETSTGRPAITAVYYGNYISVRVSKAISARVGLIGIIGRMAEETAGEIGGGGHMEAASIKAGGRDISEVMRMLLRFLNAF
jgi:RecJ-like exonuclease